VPILDLQQRLVEVGRIRMGQKNERNLPTKLNTWRLTSQDAERLAIVAQVYGGTVQEWNDEFEVVTTSTALRILVMPGHALTQWWEMWSGGGCQRRCDGFDEVISGGKCQCPAAMDERTAGARANPPTACRPTTRLSVLLPDIPGIGHWRLETHGFYAAVELAGTAGLLQMATAQGQVLPARLRVDQRHKVEGGQTTRWNVPVIDIDALLPDVLALEGHAAPVSAYQPLERTPGASLGTGLRALEEARTEPPTPRQGAQEQIPASPRLAGAPDGPPDDGVDEPAAPAPVVPAPAATAPVVDSVMISDAQRRLLFATANEGTIGEDALRAHIKAHTGQESTKAIPAAKFEALLQAVRESVEMRKNLGMGAGTSEPEPEPEQQPLTEQPAVEAPAVETAAAPAPQEEPAAEEADLGGSPAAVGSDPPEVAAAKAQILGAEFARFAGKTVYDVAVTDPAYLEWLSRLTARAGVSPEAAAAVDALREAALGMMTVVG
jgi:Recombination directionality factor-like